MPVYFIRAWPSQLVKIGHSVRPFKRLSQLQVSTGDTLTLVRLLAGGKPEEKMIHTRLADLRVRGEWFRFDNSLLSTDFGLPDLPDLAGIGSRLRWPFMMVNQTRLAAIHKWIKANSHRAMKTVLFFLECLVLADFNYGNVPIDRAKIAAEMGISPRTVTLILGELVKCNALIREGKHPNYRYRLNREAA